MMSIFAQSGFPARAKYDVDLVSFPFALFPLNIYSILGGETHLLYSALANLLPPFCLLGCLLSSWTGRSWSFTCWSKLMSVLNEHGRPASTVLSSQSRCFNYGSFHPSLHRQTWNLCTNVTTQFHQAIQFGAVIVCFFFFSLSETFTISWS